MAAAPTGLPAWEPPYAAGVALQKAKQKTKKNSNSVCIKRLILLLLSWSLATLTLLSVPGNLASAGSSYKWNCTVLVFL